MSTVISHDTSTAQDILESIGDATPEQHAAVRAVLERAGARPAAVPVRHAIHRGRARPDAHPAHRRAAGRQPPGPEAEAEAEAGPRTEACRAAAADQALRPHPGGESAARADPRARPLAGAGGGRHEPAEPAAGPHVLRRAPRGGEVMARLGYCTGCGGRTPLRRFWRAGTVRWHDLVNAGGMFRCPGAGQRPGGGS